MPYRLLLLLLALVCTPHAYEYQGKRMLYRTEFAQNFVGKDGAMLGDGTWICKDSLEDYYVYSKDTGRTWAKVQPAPLGHTAMLVGDALVAYLLAKRWDLKSGWSDISMPASWKADGLTYVYLWPNGVWAKRSYESSPKAQFYRSVDGAHSFVEWFSVPLASLPMQNADGLSFAGKVWFPVSDSGYMRGTDDGVNWSRLALPKAFVPTWAYELKHGEMVSLVGRSGDSLWYAHSQDSGKTWIELDATHPGGYYADMHRDFLISPTVNLQGILDLWISRPDSIRWEKLEGARGVFYAGENPYVLLRMQTARISMGGASGVEGNRRSPKAHLTARKTASGVEITFDASLAGNAWQWVGSDGRLLERGVVTSKTMTIPMYRGIGWMTVGSTSIALPLGSR